MWKADAYANHGKKTTPNDSLQSHRAHFDFETKAKLTPAERRTKQLQLSPRQNTEEVNEIKHK